MSLSQALNEAFDHWISDPKWQKKTASFWSKVPAWKRRAFHKYKLRGHLDPQAWALAERYGRRTK